MNKYISILLLICAVNFQAYSQADSTAFLNRTELKIGYYGNLGSDNGLNMGAEFSWKEKTRVKQKRRGPKSIRHQLLLNASLGYSTNISSKTDNSFLTNYGLIWRRTNAKNRQFFVELNPLGYYRAFLPQTYEVDGGQVTELGLGGRGYYAPSFGFGFGKLIKKKRHSGAYLKFIWTLRTSYNGGTLPNFSIQYGHRFNFRKK